MHRLLLPLILLSATLAACAPPKAVTPSKTPKNRKTVYKETSPVVQGERTIVGKSKKHKINKVIKSMFGPKGDQSVGFGDPNKADVVWVKGAHVNIVDAETGEEASPEYLCHSHIKFRPKTFNKKRRNKNFGGTTHQNLKLFTLIQGQEEIRLPDGFGIPVLSFEDFVFHAMVISNNPIDKARTFQVQSKFDWVYESERKEPLKALFRTGISMKVPVYEKGKAPPVEQLVANAKKAAADDATGDKLAGTAVDARIHGKEGAKVATASSPSTGKGLGAASSGECALPEQDDPNLNKADVTDDTNVDVNTKSVRVSGKFFGKGDETSSYHWLIPPGRHRYKYKVKKRSIVPFDTTMHHATAHMHAYAEWMELRDATTGELVYRFDVENYPDRIGIKNISHFTSQKGVKLFRNHEYELVAEYNNTTDEPIDAMAIVYMYLHDKKFDIDKARTVPPHLDDELSAASQPASQPADS